MLSRMIALAHAAVLIAAVLTVFVIAPAAAAPTFGPPVAAPSAPSTAARPGPPPARARPTPAAAPAPRAVRRAVAAAAPVPRRLAPAPVAAAPSVSRRPPTASPARVVVRPPPPAAPTAQQRLDSAVRRIPGYGEHPAVWELTDRFGSWGTADWHSDRIYISPRVPAHRLFDVVLHEWSHLRSVDAYGGDVQSAVAEMNRWFGGTGLRGAELAADCMARQLGATWMNYTTCTSRHNREGATALLEGRRLL